jgi:enoyl-CoA hydratase/carnithine racemase
MAFEAYETIDVERSDSVVEVILDRPEKYNALSTAVYNDLARVFNEIQLDRDVEVVVLTGRGDDAFCSGADIGQYGGPAEDHDPRQKDRQEMFFRDVYRKVYDLHAPVIAKINGYCVGGGLILASFCDLRIAVDEAKFGVPTTDIGQIPGGGSTYRVTQLVGEAKVKELVYTAGMIDAAEARDIGFVNRVVEREALDDEVEGLVAAIRDTGTEAVKNSKRAINYSANAPDLETAREFEAEVWWEQFATEERRELVDEFNDG